MRKLSLLLMFVLLIIGIKIELAEAVPDITYDASGIWNYTESNLQHNCPETPYNLDSGQIGLLQTEGTFIIRADEYSTQGTVSGANYNYSDKWCDFFDSVEVSFDSNASITLQSLTEGSGSVNFTATWSGGSCTGSHNLSVSRPAPVAPVYDATGKWNYTLADFSLNCGSLPFSSGFVDVVQTGNKVSAMDNSGNTFNGFVDGTLYALLRSYMEEGGRMTETILLDLSSANKGIGDAGFVWDSDCDVCWGNWQISISKGGSANIIPIISLMLDDDNNGFTYAELSGNTFQLTDIEYPICVFDLTFNSNKQFEAFGETYNYTINNGCLIWSGSDSGMTRRVCVQSRNGEQITASFKGTGGNFVDQTDQWGTDFSSLNNDATELKNWFIENGWWPGSAILEDGRVTNQEATIDGKWWIDKNVLYIDYPEGDGCVDHKAYKLENDRLMFATDADSTSTYTIVKK